MIDVIDKVRALIARTNSDFKEEARTSAFIACKLIREHGLVVGRATDASKASKAKQQAAAPPPPKAQYNPPPREPPKQQRQRYKDDDGFVARRIHTKYASSCYGCGVFIDIDEVVIWVKGEGIYHPDCAPSQYAGRRGKRR